MNNSNKMLALALVLASLCCSSSWAAPAGTAVVDDLENEIFGDVSGAGAGGAPLADRSTPIQPAEPGSIDPDDPELMEIRVQCRMAAETRLVAESERVRAHKERRAVPRARRQEATLKPAAAPIELSPEERAELEQMRAQCVQAAERRAAAEGAKRKLR